MRDRERTAAPSAMRPAAGAALAALLAVACAARGQGATPVSVPPWLEDRLIYYQSFDQDGPEVNAADVALRGRVATGPGGIRGRCAVADRAQALHLRSESFSPHLPLTVAFWWALQEEPTPETCFGLVHLGGRGHVSHFSRGKGSWCALERPAAILQVWNVPGVKNLNGIYDRDLAAHVALEAGAWHHTALVFNAATLIEVHTDGRRAWRHRLRGRPFAPAHELHDLLLGTGRGIRMALDEVLILRRALTPHEIATYVAAIRQMQAVRYP